MTKKVSIFALYETDQKAEEDGKWFEEFGPEIKIKIRRYSSEASRKGRDAMFKPYLKQFKTLDKIPDEINTDLTSRHLADFVVTDWKGIYDREGAEVPFSPEMAYDLFTKLPDLAREILLLSINMDNFRAEKKDEIKGN